MEVASQRIALGPGSPYTARSMGMYEAIPLESDLFVFLQWSDSGFRPFRLSPVGGEVSTTSLSFHRRVIISVEENVAQTKVLIVDDSPTMRGLLRFAVQRLPGATVVEAKDGIDAARILGQETFNVILLDVNMPGMNGLQLLERIRKDDRLTKTRVIMITTEGSDTSQEEAKDLGADGYLTKPVRAQQLIEAIKSLLPG